MSVTGVAEVIEYVCDNATVRWPITFTYLQDSYVLVKHFDATTNLLTTLTLGSDYTIDSDEVVTDETYPIGDFLYVSLSVEFTQDTNLEPNGKIAADVLDLVHDKLTLMCQELNITKNGSLYVELPETDVDLALPPAAVRANRILCFDSNGDVTVRTYAELDTAVEISPYAETLIAATTDAAARTILDVYSEAEADSEISDLSADLGGTGRTTETIKGNADDITDNADDISDISRGYNAISLTNWDSTSTAPQVASDSAIEANGVMYSVSTNTSISTTDASSGVNYLVFDDDAETFGWNDTAPTWSALLNGWYVSGNRFTGHLCTWDASTSYTDKRKYRDNSQDADDSLSLVWLHHYVAVTYVTKAVLYAAVSSWVPTIDSVITVVGTLVGDTFGDTASGQAQYLQRTSATTIDLIYTDIAGAKVTTECGPTYTGSPRKKYQLYTNDIERA